MNEEKRTVAAKPKENEDVLSVSVIVRMRDLVSRISLSICRLGDMEAFD